MKKGLVDQELNTTCVQPGTVRTVSAGNFRISLLEETLFIFQISSPVTFFTSVSESLKDIILWKRRNYNNTYDKQLLHRMFDQRMIFNAILATTSLAR